MKKSILITLTAAMLFSCNSISPVKQETKTCQFIWENRGDGEMFVITGKTARYKAKFKADGQLSTKAYKLALSSQYANVVYRVQNDVYLIDSIR